MAQRFPPIPLSEQSSEHKEIHEHTSNDAAERFKGIFTTHDADTGALIGPYASFYYLPKAVLDGYIALEKALSTIPGLPSACREIVILTVGASYGSPYMMYSHSRLGRKVGLSDAQILDIAAGKLPDGFTEQQAVAWEVSKALVDTNRSAQRGALPEELWGEAEAAFGKVGAGALIQYTGFYIYTSVLLNGAAVEVPVGEYMWPWVADKEEARVRALRKMYRFGSSG